MLLVRGSNLAMPFVVIGHCGGMGGSSTVRNYLWTRKSWVLIAANITVRSRWRPSGTLVVLGQSVAAFPGRPMLL